MLERPISKAGWTRVRFDQIATQINDRVDNPAESGVDRYVGLEHLDPDSLRIRRWGEPTDVESTKLRFQPGDIIFGKRRVYQRKVAVADFEGICSAHAMVLRAKPGAVLPEFLPFFMQSDLFMERALSISVGSLSPTINWKALAAEEFLLPPIQEQARLVEALNAADEADAAAQKLVEALRALLRRVRADALEGEFFRLDEVCTLRGGSGFKPSAQGSSTGEIPFIKVSDMERDGNEKYITSAANYVSRDVARELRATIFPPETTVFAKVGEALRQNRRRILVQETCIDNNMMAAIPDRNVVLPEFLYLLLLEIDFGELVQEGTVPSVNQATLGACEVMVPDLSEQMEILARVKEVETRISRARLRIQEIKGIRQKMISGGLEHV